MPASPTTPEAATRRARRDASRHRRFPALVDRVVLAVLRSPLHRLLDAELCELRYQARDTGRTVALPVLYAADGDRFVVLVGDAPDKRWWLHFTQPAAVQVCRGRQRRAGLGRIVDRDDPEHAAAWKIHFDHHHVRLEPTDRLLVIDPTLDTLHHHGARPSPERSNVI